MPIISAQSLREQFPFRIYKDIPNNRLKYPIIAAEKRLKSWVGEGNFADSANADLMKFAVANLAMHFLIVGLNTHLRNEGIVKAEQTEGDTVNSYLNPKETGELKTAYLDEARSIVRDFLIISDVEEAGSFSAAV